MSKIEPTTNPPLTPVQRQTLWFLVLSLLGSGLFVFYAVWSGTKARIDSGQWNSSPSPRPAAKLTP